MRFRARFLGFNEIHVSPDLLSEVEEQQGAEAKHQHEAYDCFGFHAGGCREAKGTFE